MNILPYSKQLKTAIELYEQKKVECEKTLNELKPCVDAIYDVRKTAVKAIRAFEAFLQGITNRDIQLDNNMAEIINMIQFFEECVQEEEHPDKLVKNSDYATAVGALVGAFGGTGLTALATTFGAVSSSGAALHGAAATNAMLAYLGGGSLAAGGGGMAAGEALLAAVGPLGWAIAGVFLTTSVMSRIHNKIDNKIMYDAARHQLRLTIDSAKRNIIEIKCSTSISSFNDIPKDYTLLTKEQEQLLLDIVNKCKLLADEIDKRFVIK